MFDFWKALTMTGRLIVGLVVLIVLLLIWAAATEPGRARERAAQAAAAASWSTGQAVGAQGAVATIGAASQTEAAIAAQTEENADEIHHAKGADVGVDPAVDLAGRRAICLRVANRGDPACVRLREVRP